MSTYSIMPVVKLLRLNLHSFRQPSGMIHKINSGFIPDRECEHIRPNGIITSDDRVFSYLTRCRAVDNHFSGRRHELSRFIRTSAFAIDPQISGQFVFALSVYVPERDVFRAKHKMLNIDLILKSGSISVSEWKDFCDMVGNWRDVYVTN